MKEVYLQRIKRCSYCGTNVIPASKEYADILASYKENQMVRAKTYGTKKERSVRQNRWLHAIFRFVAANTDNPEWDTPEKVKLQVKKKMKFFEFLIVDGTQVWFSVRSFAFDKMEQQEANIRYEDAKLVCAKFLGVEPQELQAEAQRETL